ncbi:MAG: spore germination protein [Clostridia bacterium]|nr:spore germination protein [Clostridia bacterium]
MNLKNILNNFLWRKEEKYDFTLCQSKNSNNANYIDDQLNLPENMFNSLSDNINIIKSRFNSMINTDIIIREFYININQRKIKAFIIFIDGMVDLNLVNNYILKPLMLNTTNNSENKILKESNKKNNKFTRSKKIFLEQSISNTLLPQNNIKKQRSFSEIISSINSGDCALFIDSLPFAFDLDVKGFKQRSISTPNNEVIIKGPQEAFVENLRTNTSMLRRIINNENLIIENVNIGKITKTKCAICYMRNIANDDLIAEVKYRINNLEIDSLLASGQLEQLIANENYIGIPEIISTERPDKTTKYLLQGRVIVIVNGCPYSIIMPGLFIDFMSSPEDSNIKPYFANFLRLIRLLSLTITLLLPGIYVAITNFHQEILPTELLNSILSARQSVPFPVIFEILIMEISFELIREAGVRVPSPVGPTIGIVGALVLGQAAVSANIVSPILIIIVALTGIASFAIPDFSFGFHLRIFRFAFIVLGYIAGFLGIGIGIFVYISNLCSIKSFGVSYLVPYAPKEDSNKNGYIIPPIWKQEFRANYLSTKRKEAQEKISMKWRYK